MIIRNGFVTNSSSSSFVVVRIKSKLIAEILEEFRDEIEEQIMECCGNLDISSDGSIEIYQDEAYCDTPSDLKGILDTLAGILDYNYMNRYDDYDEDEEIDYSEYSEVVQRLMEDKDAVMDSIEEAEVSCGEQGWQGDSECRYDEDWYEPDTLEYIKEDIAAEKGYDSIDEVTDKDFCDYVGDKVSTEEVTVAYDKKSGKIEVSRTTELD